MDKPKVVQCPCCGKPVEWVAANRYRPFCSERCRKIDLGAWANEEYRVPVVEEPEDPDSVPPAQ
ncbi:MAG TPA: DNA gyrase inhibitor YacG [Rhodocyclaceae bacterium]